MCTIAKRLGPKVFSRAFWVVGGKISFQLEVFPQVEREKMNQSQTFDSLFTSLRESLTSMFMTASSLLPAGRFFLCSLSLTSQGWKRYDRSTKVTTYQ